MLVALNYLVVSSSRPRLALESQSAVLCHPLWRRLLVVRSVSFSFAAFLIVAAGIQLRRPKIHSHVPFASTGIALFGLTAEARALQVFLEYG